MKVFVSVGKQVETAGKMSAVNCILLVWLSRAGSRGFISQSKQPLQIRSIMFHGPQQQQHLCPLTTWSERQRCVVTHYYKDRIIHCSLLIGFEIKWIKKGLFWCSTQDCSSLLCVRYLKVVFHEIRRLAGIFNKKGMNERCVSDAQFNFSKKSPRMSLIRRKVLFGPASGVVLSSSVFQNQFKCWSLLCVIYSSHKITVRSNEQWTRLPPASVWRYCLICRTSTLLRTARLFLCVCVSD